MSFLGESSRVRINLYKVSCTRLLTSKQLQLEGEFYQAFMEGGATVASFCSTEVEPMYKESDHIHIIGRKKIYV